MRDVLLNVFRFSFSSRFRTRCTASTLSVSSHAGASTCCQGTCSSCSLSLPTSTYTRTSSSDAGTSGTSAKATATASTWPRPTTRMASLVTALASPLTRRRLRSLSVVPVCRTTCCSSDGHVHWGGETGLLSQPKIARSPTYFCSSNNWFLIVPFCAYFKTSYLRSTNKLILRMKSLNHSMLCCTPCLKKTSHLWLAITLTHMNGF